VHVRDQAGGSFIIPGDKTKHVFQTCKSDYRYIKIMLSVLQRTS